MEFGCCASIGEISAVSNAGYSFVELRGKEIFALSDGEFAHLQRQLDKLALPCRGFNAYCPPEIVIAGPGYDRQAARSYARVLAQRGAALQIRQVGIGSPFSRRLPKDYDSALAFAQVRDFLADTAECFAPANIRVGMEPLARSFCNCVNLCNEAIRLTDALPGCHIGLILDFYNMEQNGEDDRELDSLAPLILHVHVSDDEQDVYRRSMLHPSRYAVHQERLERLRRAGYDGTLSVETDLPLHLDTAQETLRFLRSL